MGADANRGDRQLPSSTADAYERAITAALAALDAHPDQAAPAARATLEGVGALAFVVREVPARR